MAHTGFGTNNGWYQDAKHKEAVARKNEKIGMLQALIEEWEKREDWDYVRELTRKLRIAQSQKKAMKP